MFVLTMLIELRYVAQLPIGRTYNRKQTLNDPFNYYIQEGTLCFIFSEVYTDDRMGREHPTELAVVPKRQPSDIPDRVPNTM